MVETGMASAQAMVAGTGGAVPAVSDRGKVPPRQA